MVEELLIGIHEASVVHTDQAEPFNLETRFRMAKEAGVFDYYDKTPSAKLEEKYAELSEKYQLPILAGGGAYKIGKDEQLLKANLQLSARLGSRVHNTQVLWEHEKGHSVTNDEVVSFYLQAAEWGEQCGCLPTLEVHIRMWSEDFRRVNQVAEEVAKRGATFRMTLDHSHVVFKVDNFDELNKFNLSEAIASRELVIDPRLPNNVCQQWIDSDFVWLTHARAAIPNNPKNIWATHPDGSFGRGIQYPFLQPAEGQYVTEWSENELEPWKTVIRLLLKHQLQSRRTQNRQITTEFIPYPDYGGGHGYSIFENSVACAKWIRETEKSIRNNDFNQDDASA